MPRLADVADANGVDIGRRSSTSSCEKQIRAHRRRRGQSGRLTADEAAERTAELDERVRTRVDEGRPERGERGRRGPRGANTVDTAVDTTDAPLSTADAEG